MYSALVWALLSACGAPAPASQVGAGASLLGGWLLQAQLPGESAECRQELLFPGDGTFVHTLEAPLGGRPWVLRLSGSHTGADAFSAAATLSAALAADEPVAQQTAVYCGQWSEALTQTLDFAPLLLLQGTPDPATLAYRTELSADLGRVLVGSDAAERDRVVVLSTGAETLGWLGLDDPAVAALPLFFRARQHALSNVLVIGQIPALNVPGDVLNQEFSAAQQWTRQLNIVLNVTQAVDLSFGAASGSLLPGCDVKIQQDLTLSQELAGSPLRGDGSAQTLSLNPPAAGGPLLAYPTLDGDAAATLYVLPLTVDAPGGGACSVGIRARPQVLRVAEAWTRLTDVVAPLSVEQQGLPWFFEAWQEGTPRSGRFLAAERPGAGPALAAGTVLGLLADGVRLTGRLLSFRPLAGAPPDTAGYPDALGLAAPSGSGPREPQSLVLYGQGSDERLYVFPTAEAWTGSGPYRRVVPATDATPLALGGALSGSLALGQRGSTLRVSVPTPARVSFDLTATAPMAARLVDAQGQTQSGGQAAGQGAALRIVAQLTPGEFDLVLTGDGNAVGYSITTVVEAASPFIDPALADCVERHLESAGSSAAMTRLNCPHVGIRTLSGIGTLSALRAADLSGNPITDLAPLSALVELRTLDLAGSPVADLSPLAGIARLRRLSLARTPLDSAALTLLQSLGAKLTVLDLTEASGIDGAQLAALHSALPSTVLVMPDGTIME